MCSFIGSSGPTLEIVIFGQVVCDIDATLPNVKI